VNMDDVQGGVPIAVEIAARLPSFNDVIRAPQHHGRDRQPEGLTPQLHKGRLVILNPEGGSV